MEPRAAVGVPGGAGLGSGRHLPLPAASPEAFTAAPAPAQARGPEPAPAVAAGPGAGSYPAAVRSGGWRPAFRGWRRSRPFWGGLLVLLGGGEILLTYHAAFGMVVHFGLYGLAGYFVPAMLALLGVLIIFDPAHRTFYSVLSVLAALGTWLTSNLGGFIVGMLLGVIGGSLAFGWQPGERPARKRRRVRAGATG